MTVTTLRQATADRETAFDRARAARIAYFESFETETDETVAALGTAAIAADRAWLDACSAERAALRAYRAEVSR